MTQQAIDLEVAVRELVDTHGTDGATVAFLGARYDAGLAWVSQPVGAGGLGLDPGQQAVVEAALVAAGVAPVSDDRNIIGLGMAGPTLMAHGSDEQQRRWLRALWTGEEIWCQLFSEPGAGSDLAGLATTAVADDEGWVVNGQKVWTSLGHEARWGLLLARTDPAVTKHRGLSYFVCDMQAPGVDVRPLRQITGEAEFNEVFLTDVRVAPDQLLGSTGEGWNIARTTLMNERVAVSRDPQARGTGMIAAVLDAWSSSDRPPELAHELVDVWIDAESVRLLSNQLGQMRSAGVPGPEGSGLNLAFTDFQQRASSFWLELLGDDALRFGDWAMRRPAYGSHILRGAAYSYLRTRANSIEGGTSEVLRNIVAERILGLPREPRNDTELPWKDLPR